MVIKRLCGYLTTGATIERMLDNNIRLSLLLELSLSMMMLIKKTFWGTPHLSTAQLR